MRVGNLKKCAAYFKCNPTALHQSHGWSWLCPSSLKLLYEIIVRISVANRHRIPIESPPFTTIFHRMH